MKVMYYSFDQRLGRSTIRSSRIPDFNLSTETPGPDGLDLDKKIAFLVDLVVRYMLERATRKGITDITAEEIEAEVRNCVFRENSLAVRSENMRSLFTAIRLRLVVAGILNVHTDDELSFDGDRELDPRNHRDAVAMTEAVRRIAT